MTDQEAAARRLARIAVAMCPHHPIDERTRHEHLRVGFEQVLKTVDWLLPEVAYTCPLQGDVVIAYKVGEMV
jgi:hypothetical protein